MKERKESCWFHCSSKRIRCDTKRICVANLEELLFIREQAMNAAFLNGRVGARLEAQLLCTQRTVMNRLQAQRVQNVLSLRCLASSLRLLTPRSWKPCLTLCTK